MKKKIHIDTVNTLRRRVLELWLTEDNLQVENGWSVSNTDIRQMFELFNPLKICNGHQLVAFQFREEDSGNGLILAVPENENLQNLLNTMETRDNSEFNPVNYLQGDGSPYSYFLISLLLREFAEFGAFGHGVNWMDFHILSHESPADGKTFSGEQMPVIDTLNWIWYDQKPEDWSPSVTVDDDKVVVQFYSIRDKYSAVIRSHKDCYVSGKYVPHTEETVVASR